MSAKMFFQAHPLSITDWKPKRALPDGKTAYQFQLSSGHRFLLISDSPAHRRLYAHVCQYVPDAPWELYRLGRLWTQLHLLTAFNWKIVQGLNDEALLPQSLFADISIAPIEAQP